MRRQYPFRLGYAFDPNDGDEKIKFTMTVDGKTNEGTTYRRAVDAHFNGDVVVFGVMAFFHVYFPDGL